jgi:hypothetical protein
LVLAGFKHSLSHFTLHHTGVLLFDIDMKFSLVRLSNRLRLYLENLFPLNQDDDSTLRQRSISDCIEKTMERVEIVRGGTPVSLFASLASTKYILEGRPFGSVRCLIFDGFPLFRQCDYFSKQKSVDFRSQFMRTLWKMVKKYRLLVLLARIADTPTSGTPFLLQSQSYSQF